MSFRINRLFFIIGGEAGIRTLGGDQPSTVFKTAAFGRSATSPIAAYNNLTVLKINYFINFSDLYWLILGLGHPKLKTTFLLFLYFGRKGMHPN